MSKKEKLTEKFKTLPSDFTHDELVIMLGYFGFEESSKGKTAGSRRKFIQNQTKEIISLHKPHPGNIIKNYAMKHVYETLISMGYIEE